MSGLFFTCEVCGGTFIKGRSDEEAMREAKAMFGDISDGDKADVCGPCWAEFMDWFVKNGDKL